jgi:hypothetical protein
MNLKQLLNLKKKEEEEERRVHFFFLKKEKEMSTPVFHRYKKIIIFVVL